MSQVARLSLESERYAHDWSPSSSSFCKLASASFTNTENSHICISNLPTPNASSFENVARLEDIPSVITKVKWSPSLIKGSEYLACSGDGISIFKESISEDGFSSFALTGNLKAPLPPITNTNSSESTPSASKNSPAPITSFDWNVNDLTLLLTSSYDTTCTLWSLETGQIRTQLIAHDKEVFDCAFSPQSTDLFVSVGADGSLRSFDVRTLDHSTIIWESEGGRPLLRCAWNKLDPNYLATFVMDGKDAIVLDIRMPSVPCQVLECAKYCANSITGIHWAPHSAHTLLCHDDFSICLWDLMDLDGSAGTCKNNNCTVPTYTHTIEDIDDPIQSVVWPSPQPDYFSMTTLSSISINKF